MPDTSVQHLVVPVAEGGELVFAHVRGSGVWVWMRGLARQVDESPARRHGAPLYGGSIVDKEPLCDFLAAYVLDEPQEHTGVPVVPGRVRGVPPLIRRTDLKSPTSNRFFAVRDLSPLHTSTPWPGAAPELLFSLVRGLERAGAGYFATGLPELPAGVVPDPLAEPMPVAEIERSMAVLLLEFLETRPVVPGAWLRGEAPGWRRMKRRDR